MNRIETDLDGIHSVFQPEAGFRFGIDALLLAGAVSCRAGEIGCELGAGCGIVSVLLGLRRDFARIHALEIDPEMALLARENTEKNGLADRIRVIEGDLKQADGLVPEKCDFVFANPPYRKPDEGGEPSPARHELLCTIEDVCRAASQVLKGKGRFTAIFPAQRLPALISALGQAGLEAKEMLPVVPVRDGGAKLVIITARKGAKPGLTFLPAFVLREADGRESDACRSLYETGTLEGV